MQQWRCRTCQKKSEELFSYGESFFKTIGIDLIDTKFEFAMEDGELILIDEVLTPDSSRFKISKENETGLNAGYYDKQIVRDVLTNEKKDTDQPLMELSPNVVRVVCKNCSCCSDYTDVFFPICTCR